MNTPSEKEQLRLLVRDYHRLLRVIQDGYWQDVMTPFWIDQKDKLQKRAQAALKKDLP